MCITDYRLALVSLLLGAALPAWAQTDMQDLGEQEMADIAGQSGISIEIPHMRVNAHGPSDPRNGERTQGFKLDYITRGHDGGGKAHYFVNEVSLAADMEGAITLDIEEDGRLQIGLPDRIHFVGDGYSQKDIYLNATGNPGDGGKLYNEISIQGNFETGGRISFWGE